MYWDENAQVFIVCVAGIDAAKRAAMWGTNGKGGFEHCRGTCPEHRLRWVHLIDCETEHLVKILCLPHISEDYRALIKDILQDRGEFSKLACIPVHSVFLPLAMIGSVFAIWWGVKNLSKS